MSFLSQGPAVLNACYLVFSWVFYLTNKRIGFRQRIEHSLNLTEYIVQRIQSDKRFRLVEKPVYTNICFWYLPPSLRDTRMFPTNETSFLLLLLHIISYFIFVFL